MNRMDFLEPMGNRWWPIFGAVFIVSAIKRHKGMRLIGQVASVRLPAINQLAPAAERNQLRDSLNKTEVN